MTNNRAKLHGLMRNAMERVSVPIKKGEGCATLFTFDDDRLTSLMCKKTNDIADVEKNDGMK